MQTCYAQLPMYHKCCARASWDYQLGLRLLSRGASCCLYAQPSLQHDAGCCLFQRPACVSCEGRAPWVSTWSPACASFATGRNASWDCLDASAARGRPSV